MLPSGQHPNGSLLHGAHFSGDSHAGACSAGGGVVTSFSLSDGGTVVTSGSQPLFLGPLASVSPSGQHPCLLPLQPAGVVVVTIGHPSKSGPSASVLPSSQHPKILLLQSASGHPLFFLPSAGDTSSGQQPYLVSLQVSGTGQPSSNGPLADVELSGQHPYCDLMQTAFFGLGLHLRGVCSLVMIASSVFGVLPHKSVSPSSDSVESDDDVVPSSVDCVDDSLVDTDDSVTSVDSVASDDELELLSLVSVAPVVSVSVEESPVVDV